MKRPRHTQEDRLEAIEAQHGDYVRTLSSHMAVIGALQQTTAALQQVLATFIADNAAFRAEVNRRFDNLEELVRQRSNGHGRSED
jgi:hypothetical protein